MDNDSGYSGVVPQDNLPLLEEELEAWLLISLWKRSNTGVIEFVAELFRAIEFVAELLCKCFSSQHVNVNAF